MPPQMLRPRLVLASGNAHKLAELEAILGQALARDVSGLIAPMSSFHAPEPVEDGASFRDNALLKARALAAFTGCAAIADDSGLCVDIMGGAPGIFSARWSGRHGDDHANLDLLLAQLHDVPDHLRGASFVCAAALVLPNGEEFVEEGRMEGQLLRERRGNGGFGYDPIFMARGCSVSNAELSAHEKNAISHRGRALRALAPRIVECLFSESGSAS